jgi:hypothetical protein
VIADEVGHAFFEIQRFLHAADVARTVLDPDEHRPSRGVGKCYEAPEHSVGGRQVALQLEGLPLVASE